MPQRTGRLSKSFPRDANSSISASPGFGDESRLSCLVRPAPGPDSNGRVACGVDPLSMAGLRVGTHTLGRRFLSEVTHRPDRTSFSSIKAWRASRPDDIGVQTGCPRGAPFAFEPGATAPGTASQPIGIPHCSRGVGRRSAGNRSFFVLRPASINVNGKSLTKGAEACQQPDGRPSHPFSKITHSIRDGPATPFPHLPEEFPAELDRSNVPVTRLPFRVCLQKCFLFPWLTFRARPLHKTPP